jgi:hypothetical protein
MSSPEKQEDVDWSKIPKDTKTTTDIGGKDDPGRLAERKMAARAAQHPGGGSNQGGDNENPYENLQDEARLD